MFLERAKEAAGKLDGEPDAADEKNHEAVHANSSTGQRRSPLELKKYEVARSLNITARSDCSL
jgi:hypothetical protein